MGGVQSSPEEAKIREFFQLSKVPHETLAKVLVSSSEPTRLLAFRGDAILFELLTEILCDEQPNGKRDKLHKEREYLISNATMAQFLKHLEVVDALQNRGKEALGTVFEALFCLTHDHNNRVIAKGIAGKYRNVVKRYLPPEGTQPPHVADHLRPSNESSESNSDLKRTLATKQEQLVNMQRTLAQKQEQIQSLVADLGNKEVELDQVQMELFFLKREHEQKDNDDSHVLWVGDLVPGIDFEQYCKTQCGATQVHLVRKRNGKKFAFVQFPTTQHATKALNKLNTVDFWCPQSSSYRNFDARIAMQHTIPEWMKHNK